MLEINKEKRFKFYQCPTCDTCVREDEPHICPVCRNPNLNLLEKYKNEGEENEGDKKNNERRFHPLIDIAAFLAMTMLKSGDETLNKALNNLKSLFQDKNEINDTASQPNQNPKK